MPIQVASFLYRHVGAIAVRSPSGDLIPDIEEQADRSDAVWVEEQGDLIRVYVAAAVDGDIGVIASDLRKRADEFIRCCGLSIVGQPDEGL
jgi:hypothetical protein